SDWSHDGRYVLYMSLSQGVGYTYAYPVGSAGKADRLAPMAEASLSPDGNWVAFTGYPGDVFVQPFSGAGGKVKISSQGGTQAKWRAGGTERLYSGCARKQLA